MKVRRLYKFSSIAELEELLGSGERVKLYGAGYYLSLFLDNLMELNKGYLGRIDFIMIQDRRGNPDTVRDIPVYSVKDVNLGENDYVLLTLGHRFTEEVYELLKSTGAHIMELDFNMFQKKAYLDVKKSIQPLIDHFPGESNCLPAPVCGQDFRAWTCWWQGINEAPEIVKVCWESQRRYLPKGVKHVIVTEDNYTKYIELPNDILAKVQSGMITLTTLSDIIRALLLYKYGGF